MEGHRLSGQLQHTCMDNLAIVMDMALGQIWNCLGCFCQVMPQLLICVWYPDTTGLTCSYPNNGDGNFTQITNSKWIHITLSLISFLPYHWKVCQKEVGSKHLRTLIKCRFFRIRLICRAPLPLRREWEGRWRKMVRGSDLEWAL